MPASLCAARVVAVSGKGGVGKTTVAAALAVAAARNGFNVLLAELEDRVAFAPIFGLAHLGYEERSLAPNITGLTIEAEEALVDYLQHFYGIPKLSRVLVRSKIVEFATHTAPGLHDILLIGKIMESEERRRDGRHSFDVIVLDAPPTGRLPRFLDAPRAVAELVKAGPIRKQARRVLDMVADPRRLQVVLVTHPEEMPVRETAEAIEALQKMQIALGPIVVNGVWRDVPGLGRSPMATVRKDAEQRGITLGEDALERLAEVAAAHARRARNQRAVIDELTSEVALPHIELPHLFAERIGRAEVGALAEILEPAL